MLVSHGQMLISAGCYHLQNKHTEHAMGILSNIQVSLSSSGIVSCLQCITFIVFHWLASVWKGPGHVRLVLNSLCGHPIAAHFYSHIYAIAKPRMLNKTNVSCGDPCSFCLFEHVSAWKLYTTDSENFC